MADIFISYAREDKERVRPIVEELEKLGWSVFWDAKLPPGDIWRNYIGKKLDESSCVLVLWSNHSVNSKWVQKEAAEGEKRDILVPLLLDTVDPPFGFRDIHAADLTDWKNNRSHQAFKELIGVIESKISLLGSPVITPTPVPVLGPVLRKSVVNESRFFKINPKLAAVAVMVVLAVMLLAVRLTSSKQENIPLGPAPNAQSTPMPPDSAVLRAKQKANDLLLRQAKEATLNAQNEAVAARQEVTRLKVQKKEADNRHKAPKEADSSKTQGQYHFTPPIDLDSHQNLTGIK